MSGEAIPIALDDGDVEKFWAGVGDPDANGCRLWLRGTGAGGYGNVRLAKRTLRTHRVAYSLAFGPIPAGALVDHICHVTLCCAPGHLRLATRKENGENRSGAQRNSRSGVRGVMWRSSRGKWSANLVHNGKRYHFGNFVDVADAEAAVIEARLRLFTHSDPQLRNEASA